MTVLFLGVMGVVAGVAIFGLVFIARGGNDEICASRRIVRGMSEAGRR